MVDKKLVTRLAHIPSTYTAAGDESGQTRSSSTDQIVFLHDAASLLVKTAVERINVVFFTMLFSCDLIRIL